MYKKTLNNFFNQKKIILLFQLFLLLTAEDRRLMSSKEAVKWSDIPEMFVEEEFGNGNPFSRSKRKVLENRDLCRKISPYVPTPIVE